MALALGTRYVQGLFLLPITLDRGWSRETFGLMMAIQNLAWGLFQPLAGMISDRFGSGKVIATGLILYALGLLGMAHASSPIGFMLTAGVCIGVAQSGTAFSAVYGALSQRVTPERRAWALGLAGAIGGFGQLALVPATQIMVSTWDWSTALLVLSVAMVSIVPLAALLRNEGNSNASSQGEGESSMSGAIRQCLRHPGFWLLNSGFMVCGFQLAFISTHLPSYLLDKGLARTDAVAALAIIALANVLGTYSLGVLGTRFRRKHVLAWIYLGRTFAMALFFLLPLSPGSLYIFSAVMGFLWLGTAPLTNGLVSQIFGVRYIATLFGFVFLSHQIGSFFGVWLGGYLFEATRSYDLIWIIGMALGSLAAALHLPIDDRRIATDYAAVAA